MNDASWQISSIPTIGGLNQPTGIAFASSSQAFIIEKATGQVRQLTGGSVLGGSVLDLPVVSNSERGLLGVALDSDFGPGKHGYFYYSRSTTGSDSSVSSEWAENRLARFEWNGSSFVNETILLSIPSDPGQASGPNHDGGPLAIGPDGKLYGVTGDLNRNRVEQNQGTAASSASTGGLFRLNTDGSVPSDNPFVGEANGSLHRWFAYGIRNSFGMAFDPANGNLWDTENGPNEYDEINLAAPGFNSGWSDIMGPDSRDPQGVSDLVALSGSAYSDPEFSFFTPVGITALDFLYDSTLDGYGDKLLVGDNNTGNLYLFTLNASRDGFLLSGGLADLVADSTAERNAVRFGQEWGVVTDIEVAPDGSLYILSLTDGLYRVIPEPGTASLVVAACALACLTASRRKH